MVRRKKKDQEEHLEWCKDYKNRVLGREVIGHLMCNEPEHLGEKHERHIDQLLHAFKPSAALTNPVGAEPQTTSERE